MYFGMCHSSRIKYCSKKEWPESMPGKNTGKHCIMEPPRGVTAYKKDGDLRVTWAALPAHQIDGVERYLANTWPPLVGDAFPDVVPLEVNSPFAA